MKTLVTLSVALLAGCANLQFPNDASKLTPEQIRAVVADKNANVVCATITSAAGNATGVSVMLDKGSLVEAR